MNAKTFEFHEAGTGALILLGFFLNITDHSAGANATVVFARMDKELPLFNSISKKFWLPDENDKSDKQIKSDFGIEHESNLRWQFLHFSLEPPQ